MKTKSFANGTSGEFQAPPLDVDAISRDVVAYAAEYPDGHVIGPHQHTRAQLVYASTGVMSAGTPDGLWVVPPYWAVWVPAFIAHKITAFGHLSLRTLYVRPGAAPFMPSRCTVVAVPPLLRELILHAMNLDRYYEAESHAERIMKVIVDLLETLDALPLSLPLPKDPMLERIVSELTKDPADHRTLADWSTSLGASTRTLARHFRAETGMGFREWRRQLRIVEALKRLGRGEPVTNVALDVGYDSVSAFITMFRETLGKTPGCYFDPPRGELRLEKRMEHELNCPRGNSQ